MTDKSVAQVTHFSRFPFYLPCRTDHIYGTEYAGGVCIERKISQNSLLTKVLSLYLLLKETSHRFLHNMQAKY